MSIKRVGLFFHRLIPIVLLACLLALAIPSVVLADATWSPMSSATTNNLNDVWGSSASDVFAVGDSGTILHYNGSTWSAMGSGTTNSLKSVWGNSATDVFAAAGGCIYHYDGSAWSLMTILDEAVNCAWGSSSTDIFAGGSLGESGAVWHYDGTAWSLIRTAGDWVTCLWGSSSTDVFFGVGIGAGIMHYNGSTWTGAYLGHEPEYVELCEIWGSSSSDVFAIGDGFAPCAIWHYDGSAWSLMVTFEEYGFCGLWASSSFDVFAVGSFGAISHYDGSAWSSMTSGTTNHLTQVWGSSPSDVFAVGYGGVILHYAGGATAVVDPAAQRVAKGGTFSVDIVVNPNGYGVSGGEMNIAFDPSAMSVVDIVYGDLFGANPLVGAKLYDNTLGTAKYALARVGTTTPPTSTGKFATITFTAKSKAGTYPIDITSIGLADENFNDLPAAAITNSTVTVGYPKWDINQDGKVDYKDLAILGAHYGQTSTPPYPAWDINQDGKIDYKDLAILGAHYGEVY
jgi:hypothetical protein